MMTGPPWPVLPLVPVGSVMFLHEVANSNGEVAWSSALSNESPRWGPSEAPVVTDRRLPAGVSHHGAGQFWRFLLQHIYSPRCASDRTGRRAVSCHINSYKTANMTRVAWNKSKLSGWYPVTECSGIGLTRYSVSCRIAAGSGYILQLHVTNNPRSCWLVN